LSPPRSSCPGAPLGLGTDEFDEVADVIAATLRATEPVTVNFTRSKASYTLPARVAAECRTRCADLLSRFPLYPTIQL
jgi:glycine hydroxymethyltransferase